ncbi:MAG: hypothetical protein IAC13_06355 [Firmicutes bacterium]|uniref:Peptidase S54 rhomboid domain-containing protein n=1 Tax=Candidatus Scybalomonas excrementavium TaxID=2840943 RepID=A0A9D9I0C5_9FIRM|nr:hypothetical protein [Candidatus Scybalomonas excrementavium]
MNFLGKFLNRLERKFGHLAIHNLPMYIVVLYGIGFFMQMIDPNFYLKFSLNPYFVFHGEPWRVLTFLVVPPSSNAIFIIFVLLFYYSICQSLENIWGSFRFNLYYFTGVIGTILAALISYVVTKDTWIFMDTYYLNLSLFLAFAASFPDMIVYFMFILPVKVKWLGVLDGIYLLVEFINGGNGTKIAIVVAMLNFVLFFFATRNYKRVSPQQIRRKHKYQRAVRQSTTYENGARHRCTICGRTELDDPNLEFRYCSKCDGDHEYCQEHLFTHTHIKK